MCNKINAQTPDLCSKIDSICILSLNNDVSYAVSVPRAKFEDYWHDQGAFDFVKDRDKIEDICTLLNDLTPSYESFDCGPNKKVSIIDGYPRFVDTDIIDVRSLLVLYMENTKTLVWVGQGLTGYECNLYYTSEKLYSYLEKYEYKYYFEKRKN